MTFPVQIFGESHLLQYTSRHLFSKENTISAQRPLKVHSLVLGPLPHNVDYTICHQEDENVEKIKVGSGGKDTLWAFPLLALYSLLYTLCTTNGR